MDVSIVITAYNYAAYITECIDSCLQQQASPLDYEVIVIDDGSTDQTPVILDALTHPRLRKFRIENSGIEIASNTGFAKAEGRYIVRLDADDKFAPDYLAQMAAYLSGPSDFFYPDYSVIDGDGNVTEQVCLPNFQPEEIRCRGDFLATGTLYRAALLRQPGGYSTDLKNSGLENYELILRLMDNGAEGQHIPAPLFYYRRHALNISATKRDQIIRNGRTLFASKGWGEFTTNQFHPYKLELT